MPLARLRGHGVLVDDLTDVLIEGYPRSANSFAVAAFGHAQPGPVRIAHHTHAPAHVIEAVGRGVPAIVLVRDPADSVLEFVIVKPALTVAQALRGYVRFYAPLLAHRRGFVVGTFEEVTSDFGSVIGRLNSRFGTAFAEFEHTAQNERACFEAMEGYWRGRVGEGVPVLGRGGGASELAGDLDRRALEAEYRSARLREWRAKAELLHRRLVPTAPPVHRPENPPDDR